MAPSVLLATAHPPWDLSRRPGHTLTRCLLALLTSAAAFVISSPFIIAEHAEFLRALRFYGETALRAMPGMEGLAPLPAYILHGLPAALSIPLLFLALIGIPTLVCTNARLIMITLVPFALYAAVLLKASLVQYGFLFPLLPLICILAAAGLWAVFALALVRPALLFPALLLLSLIAVGPPFPATACNRIASSRPSAQERASQWISRHIPTGTRILGMSTGLDFFLPLTTDRLLEILKDATAQRPSGGHRIRHMLAHAIPGSGYYLYDTAKYEAHSFVPHISEYSPAWIRAQEFQYLIDSEDKTRLFLRAPEQWGSPYEFQRWLEHHAELLYTTHSGSRGLVDWRGEFPKVREFEPACGFVGGELRLYRVCSVS